jgi:hypothetical protein
MMRGKAIMARGTIVVNDVISLLWSGYTWFS